MGGKFHIILFIIILLNSISLINNNHSKIIIPLYYSNNDNISNYIEFLLQGQLYAKIKLGSPEQIIYLLISTDTSYFSIESHDINKKFYDSNKSSTFSNTDIKFSFYKEKYKSGSYCTDQFYLINNIDDMKEVIYKNITFDYINSLSEEYILKEKKYYIDKNYNELSGIIGLQIPKSLSYISVLQRFYNIKAISKNIWSIFTINSQPYLLLGEDPYINDQTEVKRTNCYVSEYYHYWYFLFNDIKVGNTKLKEERIAQYSPQIGVIIGVKEYKNYIQKNFFNDLIMNEKCRENNLTLNEKFYSYYECDSDINLDNFEPLEFIHQELSYKFILDKNDLFADFNNKKYFLVIFLEKVEYSYQNSNNWMFGTPFIKKYNFVFDQDRQIILFYENNNKNTSNDYKSSGNSSFTIIIIIFLSIFTGIIIVYLVIKIIFKPKQIKANELEDSFSYKNQDIIDNDKENINAIYNSKYNKLGI